MKNRALCRRVAGLLAILMLLWAQSAGAPARAINQNEPGRGTASRGGLRQVPGAYVDPRVWDDTQDGQNGRFLVVLREQTDARAVARQALTASPQDRGPAVFAALYQTAADSQGALRARLDDRQIEYRSLWIVNLLVVRGDRRLVEELAAHPDVQAIEADRPFQVDLESPEPALDESPASVDGVAASAPSTVEWNIARIGAPGLWQIGYRGQGLSYASADTGVQWNHPALIKQYRGWDGQAAQHDYHWWDAIHEDINGNAQNPCGFSSPVPCDDNGHGTHTTGIAVGDDGAGNQIGVAPGARWIGCRNMEQGVGRPSTYIECLQFFLAPTDLEGQNPRPELRPDVVGNSYGCPPSEGCTSDSLAEAVEKLRAAGTVIAVSAGNDGNACGTVHYPPALHDAATTVGATGSTDQIAALSSRGPVKIDGSYRRKPDLVAPGILIRSSYLPGSLSGLYANLSGTSMAAPHVAGAVLLLWSAVPALRGDVDTTEMVLGHSAVHLTSAEGCGGDGITQVPNNVYGYGRIDVPAAHDYVWRLLAPVRLYLPQLPRS